MSSSIIYNTQLMEAVKVLPVSFAQQRLWLLDQLEPDSAAYTIISHLRLKVLLNVDIFKRSLDAIIQRHNVLRTAITMIDGQLVQVIAPSLTLALPLVDLQHLPEAEREGEILRLATEEALRPFDIRQSPLIRTTLLRLGQEDYLLLLSVHHIISDGWSIGLFCQELAVLYEAFLSGQSSPLTPVPMQYADFTLWQNEQLQGNMLADQLAYWKKQLENTPTALMLPTDRSRPSVRTSHGAVQPLALSTCLTDDLKALSSQEGVSLYVILVAAFQTLLHRYTAQDDILIGSPVVGRTLPETENVIGSFINTLVLRTDLSGNPTFRELLERVRSVIFEAQAHQDMPFEYLVKELQLERNMAQTPFFQVMLALEPPPPALSSSWTLTQMNLKTSTSEFDLSLVLDDRPEGLIGRFEYSADLFDAATIHRMVGQWQSVLESIVADAGQRIGELSVLTEAERHQILVEWNPTDAEYPKDKCIHQVFESQVECTPDAVAVIFEDRCLTYQELNRRANQLAHLLQRLGVGQEVLVGIYLERSPEMVVGLLGILKAGGAYVPLDPAYPADRLNFMLKDAQISMLVTQQHLITNLPTHDVKIICLDAIQELLVQESPENPASNVKADNLAYAIYTSGSTGNPKGVLVTHQNVVHSTVARLAYYDEHIGCLLLFPSLSFDISVAGIFWTLCQGNILLIPQEERHSEISYLIELIAKNHVTHFLSVSSFYKLLLEQSRPEQMITLRTVIVGGEPCPPELVECHYKQLPQTHLFNEYGPTEGTIWSSVYRCEPQSVKSPISIGRPIPNTQIYLLDTYQQLVPIGVPGELYIGGAGVARGYLNRLELTSERFIPDPFSENPDARLYKTGDLAHYLPNGNIDFLGRIDQQVKIRGFRIELGEIEAVLAQHSAVLQAVVVTREDEPGEKRLVAYIVLHKQQAATTGELQSHVAKQLPAYMVPSTYILLDVLPTTPNSKIDRRALPILSPTSITTKETYVAPVQVMHYQLVHLWEELLGVQPIGIQDNFFDLGGHSLLAARLVSRIERLFGKKIPLATFFVGPTVDQLTNALQQQEEDLASRSPIVAVQKGDCKRPFFFLHGDYAGGAFYCFPLARKIGQDQPFYSLGPYRFDGLRVPPTFKDMTTTYIELLRAVQPEGPYLLGGFCNGGLMVSEIARQLHTQGLKVDLLISIDPPLVVSLKTICHVINHFGKLLHLSEDKRLYVFLWLRHMYRYLEHVYRYLRYPYYKRLKVWMEAEQKKSDGGAILELDARYQVWLDYEGERLGISKQTGSVSWRDTTISALFPDAIFPPAHVLRRDWPGMFCWSYSGYEPDFYPGRSTFFFFGDGEDHHRNAKRRKAVGKKEKEIEVHVIAGTQATSKTEHLHDLAERLRTCLSKAQRLK